jgi:hypothetical protein
MKNKNPLIALVLTAIVLFLVIIFYVSSSVPNLP